MPVEEGNIFGSYAAGGVDLYYYGSQGKQVIAGNTFGVDINGKSFGVGQNTKVVHHFNHDPTCEVRVDPARWHANHARCHRRNRAHLWHCAVACCDGAVRVHCRTDGHVHDVYGHGESELVLSSYRRVGDRPNFTVLGCLHNALSGL